MVIAILIAIAFTLFATFILMNVTTGEKKIKKQIVHRYGIKSEQFARAVSSLLGPPLLDGNNVTTLTNGNEIFPAMLGAIKSAEKTICFETFIYWSGHIGKSFSKELSEKAKAGVKVHVLLDWVGTGKMENSFFAEMKDAGVEIEKYHPIRWYTLFRLNNRTHRKLLIVDGKVGFTGGVGIADQWQGNAEDKDHWRDSHFRLEGPTVSQLQSAFMDNWIKTKAEVLHDDPYFPPLEPRGNMKTQVFKSSANEGAESIRLMYLLSLASAEESILIVSAYFVPDDLTIQTMVDARKRGVVVEIIVPNELIDSPVVRKASRGRWGKLLEAGVKIYEYQPTMLHAKNMIIDSIWVSVGSTNFDNRSFRLNDEANLNILDETFAKEQEKAFRDDRNKAKEITLEAWRSRPIYEKCVEKIAMLFRSQL